MRILLSILFILFSQNIFSQNSPCDKGWLANVSILDQNGLILKTDTCNCGFKYISDISDWVTNSAQEMTGMVPNWEESTTMERLYDIKMRMKDDENKALIYNIYYIYCIDTVEIRSNLSIKYK